MELLQESKSMEINEVSIGILLACKGSLEEQLTNYDSLEENEENDKKIENSENVTDTGKRVMNKLKGI